MAAVVVLPVPLMWMRHRQRPCCGAWWLLGAHLRGGVLCVLLLAQSTHL